MDTTTEKLSFSSDYTQTAHPLVMRRLLETGHHSYPGYGADDICAAAQEKIRAACAAPQAEVFFLTGGTQTNATVIDALLPIYQGVISAETGHIGVHEAGAIEAGGHKVLTLPQTLGKFEPDALRRYMETFTGDENHEHMVMPGMVYISQPTEYGTLYSLGELKVIRAICDEYGLKLYADGARLAYALASPQNDVTLGDLAALCDVFYIGGTKCGAMLGEAVVITRPGSIPHFLTIIKQHGALLAKGWIQGAQFDALFTNGLYDRIGENAIRTAARLQDLLRRKGYPLLFDSPTNQVFVIVRQDQLAELSEKVSLSFWERLGDGRTVIRLATSWATTDEDIQKLEALL